jgi:phospholipase C
LCGQTATKWEDAVVYRRGVVISALCVLAFFVVLLDPRRGSSGAVAAADPVGIHKIQHVVIIMQENRSFDSYFGTFPGADGIPMKHGVPTVCIPDPRRGTCARPYLDNRDRNVGGPHALANAVADIDGGKMDGFVSQAENTYGPKTSIDVLGYHDQRSIPNYWSYARHFVLNDHMFASTLSWSLPEHLYMVSGWAARCTQAGDPMSCGTGTLAEPPDRQHQRGNLVYVCGAATITDNCRALMAAHHIRPRIRSQVHALIVTHCDIGTSFVTWSDSYTNATFTDCLNAVNQAPFSSTVKQVLTSQASYLNPPDYAWTDITYLLDKYGVSWRYYVMNGSEPDCRDDAAVRCPTHRQNARTPGIWNPLPYFDTVRADNQVGNVRSLRNFYVAARHGELPAVSWITPSGQVSEHPPGLVRNGQAYVTGLINTIMRSPDWSSTAIFLSWDDWGGFYDHVKPPNADVNGYGLRVPGLVISPYAKRGYVDHQVLSHDAYLKFIEDDFLNGQRIDPATDGRPDNRPTVREDSPLLGDLSADFNFSQKPLPPLVLPGQTIY